MSFRKLIIEIWMHCDCNDVAQIYSVTNSFNLDCLTSCMTLNVFPSFTWIIKIYFEIYHRNSTKDTQQSCFSLNGGRYYVILKRYSLIRITLNKYLLFKHEKNKPNEDIKTYDYSHVAKHVNLGLKILQCPFWNLRTWFKDLIMFYVQNRVCALVKC